MAAIAIAESGGYEKRVSPPNTDGTVDRGLWQINSVHGKASTVEAKSNAASAVKIYQTQGLHAWTTYTNGAYKQFMKGGVAPDPNLPSGSTPAQGGTAQQAGLAGDLGGAIGQGFASAFSALIQPLISFAIWGTEIMLGGVLLLVGVLVFLANTDKGKEAIHGTARLGMDAASIAVPEAAPELQIAKGGIKKPSQIAASRARKNAAQTQKARAENEKLKQAKE
jgi:hypothetical protein